MKFEEAYEQMKNGRKIKIDNWGDVYLYIENGNLCIGGNTGKTYCLSTANFNKIFDGNWEIYEEGIEFYPCPFCKSSNISYSGIKGCDSYIYCNDCGVRGPKDNVGGDFTVKRWNKLLDKDKI